MHLHRQPYGLHVDIVARSIDRDEGLTAVQKAERAVEINLPIADPEVILYAKRWVEVADRQGIKSNDIEQLREVLRTFVSSSHKQRGSRIRPTPVLEQSLLSKLLSSE